MDRGRGFVGVVLAMSLLVAMGCGEASERGRVDRDEVLAIARREVRRRESWSADAAVYDVSYAEDGWTVMVMREPPSPGGHRMIQLDVEGRVRTYFGGR